MARFATKGVGYDGSAGSRLDSSYTSGTPGKRTLTDGIVSRRSPYDRTGEALDDVYREVRQLREQHIPEARSAFSGREFQRSRDAAFAVRIGFSRAESRLQDARSWLQQVDPTWQAKLLEELAVAEGQVEAVRPEVLDVQRLAPSTPASSSQDFSLALGLGREEDYLDFEAKEARLEEEWNTTLDEDEATKWENAQAAPLRDDVCQVDGPRAEHTFQGGIQLYILAQGSLPKYTAMWDHKLVGPGVVGPYRVMACTFDNKIAFYQAIHTQRHQAEWVIGPDHLTTFQENIDLYVGAARASLPGSSKVEASQEDGAAKPPHLPSMLELEAFGEAPHQSFNLFEAVSDANDKGNGGSALVSARNMHLRLSEYTKEAERLAHQLKAQMASGEVPHDVARVQAVEGRNQLMRNVREKLSPSGRYASQFIKSDQGISVEQMTERKTRDLLKSSMGESDEAMKVLGAEGTSADLRKVLAQDSALWEQYRRALDAGDDVKRVFSAAVQELGAQPAVSRAIVHSAGKSNSTMTGIAKAGRVVAGAAAIYGVYDMVATIANAEEGQRLHVAGAEFGGFAGGIVGAELGAMGAVWIASLLIPNPSTPAIIVISLIGGGLGGMAGAEAGHAVGGPLVDSYKTIGQGMQAVMGPGAAQNGGYAGLYERSRREGMGAKNLNFILSNAIFELDQTLTRFEAEIAQAPDREKLEAYQVARLEVLESRDQLGYVYSALQSGVLSEEDVWQLLGKEPNGAP